jgi:hypothetical protein
VKVCSRYFVGEASAALVLALPRSGDEIGCEQSAAALQSTTVVAAQPQ